MVVYKYSIADPDLMVLDYIKHFLCSLDRRLGLVAVKSLCPEFPVPEIPGYQGFDESIGLSSRGSTLRNR